MAIDLSRPQSDVSIYVNDARGVAQSHQLDFLDFVSADGSIVSSAEWSARFGYKLQWVTQPVDWATQGSFLTKVDTPGGPQPRGHGRFNRARGRQESLRSRRAALKQGVSGLAGASDRDVRALLYQNLTAGFQPQNLLDQSARWRKRNDLLRLSRKKSSNWGSAD